MIVPSISAHGGPESLGRTILEAWAYGRPVIAFAAGGPRHLIQPEIDGLLVPEGDVAQLADSIRSLIITPQKARALGMAGRQRVEQEFSIEAVASRMADRLHALLTMADACLPVTANG